MRGKIIKGIAGFYYVHANEIYECRAKGVFRKDKRKPLVGDDVELEILDGKNHKGNITDILPRRSELIRPAVANVEQALVIFAIKKPQPNFNLLDRFLIMMGQHNLPCIICFNKLDIDYDNSASVYEDIYKACGYTVLSVSAEKGVNIDKLKNLLSGRTTTVAGPSGVGKSSIINSIQSGTVMEIGDISERIDRGRHTTRHSELIAVDESTYILDTPGFSSLGLFNIEKEELAGFYPEFCEYEKYCRFGGCSHISEPICGVKLAVERGDVSSMRYENYKLLYNELKDMKRYRRINP
ncbi:MAG: ribosome small subunit-dependent GTPase A [Lachnospiraceae bacterium]|nr:ribosome small subunit-dependent GTPase A [Lachnospiraceae bacterium]